METEEAGRAIEGPGRHPTDRLPDYVHGAADDPEAIEAHLASCASCRREVELIRALAGPGPVLSEDERESGWRRLAARVRTPASRPDLPADPDPGWRSVAWKAVAAAALVVMGLGVWQVNRHAGPGGGWDPTAAVLGWEEDVRALRPAPEDVRVALGYDLEGAGIPWEVLEERDPFQIPVPWERTGR